MKPIIQNAWFQLCNIVTNLIIWAAICWYSAGPIITLQGRIIASDYVGILGNQVHPVVQMLLPNNNAIFQDDNSPIHTQQCSVLVSGT